MRRSSDPPAAARTSTGPRVLDVETPLGLARAHVHEPAGGAVGTLVLGHGAGGGIAAPDLRAATVVAVDLGWRAVLVEQPWRVAGGRVAPAPARLDVGWLAVLAALADADSAEAPLVAAPLVVGGRSAGARVACRTALATGARGVLCLAFPLHPPGRPERSRAAELAGAGVDVHVVQGRRDAFGGPAEIEALDLPRVHVAPVDGDHGLKAAGGGGVREAVAVALGMLGPDAVF